MYTNKFKSIYTVFFFFRIIGIYWHSAEDIFYLFIVWIKKKKNVLRNKNRQEQNCTDVICLIAESLIKWQYGTF